MSINFHIYPPFIKIYLGYIKTQAVLLSTYEYVEMVYLLPYSHYMQYNLKIFLIEDFYKITIGVHMEKSGVNRPNPC